MPRGGHNRVNSGIIEGARSLNVMALARTGFVGDRRLGRWQWTDASGNRTSIQISGGIENITLNYRWRAWSTNAWQDVEQRVPIVWKPCRFGGRRPWFRCVCSSNGRYCGRKVAKLYGVGRLFACRHCWRLVYAVQWDNAMDRGHRRLGKLYQALGADYDCVYNRWPNKPLWMRQRTYARLLDELAAAEGALDAVFYDRATRLLRRCGAGIKTA